SASAILSQWHPRRPSRQGYIQLHAVFATTNASRPDLHSTHSRDTREYCSVCRHQAQRIKLVAAHRIEKGEGWARVLRNATEGVLGHSALRQAQATSPEELQH